ncbi:MAG TPA: hypothetical protein VMF14_17410 [Solirubrobacteraceae bacterium]|nr:hypothetical protein [Solirubrobacteraceae bacterium]
MRTTAHGLSVDVPAGWEARIVRLPESAPYLHLASFALTADVGQFGAGATAAMGPDTAFAALVEYLVDRHARPGTGLFASRRWPPRLRVGEFGHDRLQVMRPGHLGAQRFFTVGRRPFCLYTVIAPVRRRPAQLIGELSAVLATVAFDG